MADAKTTEGHSVLVKVFINHVDTYSGIVISRILSRSPVGGTSDNTDDVQSQDSNIESPLAKDNVYQICGTLKNENSKKPEWVYEIFEYERKEDLLPHLILCDIIIYDIISDPHQVEEATWAVSAMNAEISNLKSLKLFICISTVLTWARTKPVDPEDPEIPFTEEDYRKRKPHPNFRSHLSCEKQVIKLGKTNKSRLMTYVVAAGLTYGEGENIFHFLFKSAWTGNKQCLHIYGSGSNIVPTIHIKDLANGIVCICDQKPKARYILAVDDSNSTLEEIVRSISKSLGNGKVKFVDKEIALLEKDIAQTDFDTLLVNLRIDSTYLKEVNIPWVSEFGLPDNITKIIKEFKNTRNLLPLRACILGPPTVGKTTVIKQLCAHYKIHHIQIHDVIDEAIAKLKTAAARADGDIEDEDDDIRAQENQKMLDDIAESKEKNNGRIEDVFITEFFKEVLHSMPCQNQGFILDGYPKTMGQAKELFTVAEPEEEIDEKEHGDLDTLIVPEFIVSLNASDEFLRNRIMNLPEAKVTGTHNTEEGFQRRLLEFRSLNTDDETVLNFFDELEIHPEPIDVTQDHTPDMRQTVEKIIKIMGKERNYGPTPDEIAEMRRSIIEKEMEEKRRKLEEAERLEAEEARDRAKKLEEWRTKLNDVKQQEQEMLEAQSIPLRNYLMKHVMPTLTQGLIECTKARPDDPIDFLAEFLFEHNPQID